MFKLVRSIIERSWIRILGLDYRTIGEQISLLNEEVKNLKTMAQRTERKVYRAEEQSPDITHLQQELEVSLESVDVGLGTKIIDVGLGTTIPSELDLPGVPEW